jgi:hypothetical protein
VLCETEHRYPGYICIQIWSNYKCIHVSLSKISEVHVHAQCPLLDPHLRFCVLCSAFLLMF